ncbi:hypothetical protein ACFVYR_20715 [Streptomyces sp. NPDC058284]|uniref:hypothetical protein n=1 Tax=unclassified Streptomyces TaxID=2593676 RepID=UPI0036525EE9
MTTSTSPGNDIALGLIAQDLMFLRRVMQGAVEAGDRAIVPLMCMYNYSCLMVHESHRALRAIETDLAQTLVYDCADVIERARHSVKLFDDTQKKLPAIGADFGRIIEAHRAEFLGNTWLPLARPLETDLALWRYQGRVISTSHVMNFFMSFSPSQIHDPPSLGRELRTVASEISRYTAAATGELDWTGTSFMEVISKSPTAKDVRAKKTYQKSFDPAIPEEIKAALTAFTCALNVVDVLLAEETNGQSDATVVKLRYVTLHHTLSSLTKLANTYGSQLRPSTRQTLEAILTAPMSLKIIQANPQFRNTLVHYRPDGRVRDQLSLDAPLFGLVSAYFGEDFTSFTAGLAQHVRCVAQQMEGWSNW